MDVTEPSEASGQPYEPATAGWYPNGDVIRYWDGVRWTRLTRDPDTPLRAATAPEPVAPQASESGFPVWARIAIGALAGLGAWFLLAGGGWEALTGQAGATRTVEITVTGNVDTALYTVRAGSQSQQVLAPVPFAGDGSTYYLKSGDFVYISAQMQSANGNLRCEITVDGVSISTGIASDGYGIAECSGTV